MLEQAGQLKAAVVQLNSGADLEQNLARVEHWVRSAAEEGARLIALPENFSFFGDSKTKARLAEPISLSSSAPLQQQCLSLAELNHAGNIRRSASRQDERGVEGARPSHEPAGKINAPMQRRLTALAKELKVSLILGGFAERSAFPERPYNTSALVQAGGHISALYRKLHLFDVDLPGGVSLKESAATCAGEEVVVAELEGLKVGLSICYDMRFPELYRLQRQLGAQVLTAPSAFTSVTGAAHWHVLLRSRAVESQAWLLAPAQWGKHPGGRECYGHSLIVNPWGEVVAELPSGEGFVCAEINLARVAEVRGQMPCWEHRRLI